MIFSHVCELFFWANLMIVVHIISCSCLYPIIIIIIFMICALQIITHFDIVLHDDYGYFIILFFF